MGTSERRERERQELRHKILEAARELLVSEGYERMTMRRIALAIEYSPTAIYHHFKDKDEVVHTLCQEDFGRLLGAMAQAPAPADPLAAIRGLGLAYARFALQFPNHYRFMFMVTRDCAGQSELADNPGWQAFGLLRQAVEAAQARGLLRPAPADTLAQVLWSCIHGAVALLITFSAERFPGQPAEDLIEQVIETGLRGLLARPKPLASEVWS